MVYKRFWFQYVQNNKDADNDWFRLESNKEGTKWFGKCWYIHDLLRYEFDVEFDVSIIINIFFQFEINKKKLPQIPITYPNTAPEIALPELDGKTAKMYRGGKICLSDHFKPLWARNVPKFGIAHAMALGVSFICRILLTEVCICICFSWAHGQLLKFPI